MISFNDLKTFLMEKNIKGKPNIKEIQFHTAFPKLCVYQLSPNKSPNWISDLNEKSFVRFNI